MIIFGTNYALFLPLYQITFFLAFGHAKILTFLFTYCFVTKKSVNYIPYRKTFQNKKRTCFNKAYLECVKINLCSQLFACFAFTGINFRGMLHHVCDVPMTKISVDQSEFVNVGAQID